MSEQILVKCDRCGKTAFHKADWDINGYFNERYKNLCKKCFNELHDLIAVMEYIRNQL